MSEDKDLEKPVESNEEWTLLKSRGCLIATGVSILLFFVGCAILLASSDSTESERKVNDYADCMARSRAMGVDGEHCRSLLD